MRKMDFQRIPIVSINHYSILMKVKLKKGLASIIKNPVFKAILFNPIIILLYFLFSSVLLTFFDYGGTARRLPILLGISGSFVIWFIFCIVFRKKIRQHQSFQNPSLLKLSTYWFWIAIFTLIGITVYTGIQTAEIAQAFGTSLHRQILAWQTETHIDLEETNLFEQDIDELFFLIDQEMGLPDELYISNYFDLEFNQNGELLSLYTSIYGENEAGSTESFLIMYNSNDQELVVHHDEFESQSETDDRMLLSPLKETAAQLSLEEIIQEWPNEERFGIYYLGYRTWGYNSEGMYYLENEEPFPLPYANDEIIGYTVSVYVPGKTEELTPQRYIDRSFNSLMEAQLLEEEQHTELGYQVDDSNQEVYFLTEEIGFRLPVIDAATGTRWYGFEKTEDGGAVWETVNQDPFDEQSGVTSGIKFFDEEFGFIILGNANQTEGILFRTENGGETFDPIDFPPVEVPLNDEEEYNPFQYPEIPYEENGRLYTLLGQGAHGDYNMGAKALYQSEDNGITWEFVEEVNENQ